MGYQERTHARFSPSKLHRIFACPGSVRQTEGVEELAPSKWALDGTKAHELLELVLEKKSRHVSSVLESGYHESYDDKMISAVQDCVDYIYSLTKAHKKFKIYSELKVDPPIFSAPGEAAGHLDVAVWLPENNHLYVIDFKYGVYRVLAKDNPQLLAYAGGAMYLKELKDAIKKVTLTIVQPRVYHSSETIDEDIVTRDDVKKFLVRLDLAIARSLKSDAPLVPTDAGCKWCPAYTTCPAISGVVLSATKSTSLKNISHKGLPKPSSLTPEEIAFVLNSKKVITNWLNKVEQEAQSHMESGTVLPGYKLVRTRKRREWYGTEEDIAKQLMNVIQCPIDEVMPRRLITLTAAERLVIKKFKSTVAGTTAKKKAAEKAKAIMSFLTLKKGGDSTVVVPNTDSRPEINSTRPDGTEFGHVQVIET